MEIIRTVKRLEEALGNARSEGLSIGLVPTMGALHAGHKSLVDCARAQNDVVVVSVFVNPTQFNNAADLATYPRTEAADEALLDASGVDYMFLPSVEEVYPQPDTRVFNLGPVAEVMEGPMRPGHFNGVCQIVSKLFAAVAPDRAYFGEKDFQQIAVIRNMVASEGIKVEIVACPIKRANDGLALSSRNALLSPAQRALAPSIHAALAESVAFSKEHSVRETHAMVVEKINAVDEMEVEYFEIVDARTLAAVEEWEESPWIVGCITVYCGKVRLIDNIAYRLPKD